MIWLTSWLINQSINNLQEGDPESPSATQPTLNGSNGMMAQVDECGGTILSRTNSSRPISRSRHSSFRTNSLEPIASPQNPSTRPLRLHSFKRNRPSFIHVTAEAMNRQRSQRLHSSPWEYHSTGWVYIHFAFPFLTMSFCKWRTVDLAFAFY